METTILNATEYRNVSLSLLSESKTNPRRIFEDAALRELADSIRSQGVLSPLLIRPLTEKSFEIVAGARRFRAAQIAEVPTVPVRIVNLSDAEALEAQLIENLQRRDVHPLEEAQGFRALLNLEEPKYSVEQIAAKTGKSPAYVTTRLKLTELSAPVIEAFYAEEIGVGHPLLLAKLQPGQQEAALAACFREDWQGGSGKQKRILLPLRNLQFWIDSNILLILKDAPFDKKDGQLVPAAGSCIDCPKRTGHNKLLFSDLGKQDACTDPTCYQSKVETHVVKIIAAKPQLVQISTAYGQQKEGNTTLPRNKYTEIRADKPSSKEEAKRPEFKTCKFTSEAIVTEGEDVGTFHKVCANPTCPVHHPKQSTSRDDAKWKAEQEKQRREQAIANTVGLRVLSAIGSAVPVRLMKRDLLSVTERLLFLIDENRVEMLARQHGIRQKRNDGGVKKTFTAFVRRADEGTLSRLVVEASILLAASRGNPTVILKEAAASYKVDTDAITTKVRQEFAAKEKAKKAPQPVVKNATKAA
ncbi:ParB family chromosome partitioning protein [Edaphobacter aggregans]|uniref:ParB family chromosome partitioning protein n=1 Tax=Edaphobacter aggregans TaxID=570835 RepID=A0A428MNK8_9BACT|nr:ParB/RepB/Spo0J family partition protein [Edaphobacter aggregans]RSL18426.1 ParB family chromosome partitioning protein [Edaphobacter aggregans]